MAVLAYHLIVVEGFACPKDPRSSVVCSFMLLLGLPMGKQILGEGLDKGGGPLFKKGDRSCVPTIGGSHSSAYVARSIQA